MIRYRGNVWPATGRTGVKKRTCHSVQHQWQRNKKEEKKADLPTFPRCAQSPSLNSCRRRLGSSFRVIIWASGTSLHPQTDTREKCHHTPPGPFNTHNRSLRLVRVKMLAKKILLNISSSIVCCRPRKEYFSIFIIDISVSPIDNRLFTVAGCVQRVVEREETDLLAVKSADSQQIHLLVDNNKTRLKIIK